MLGFVVMCWIAIAIFAWTEFWPEEAKAVLTWPSPFLRGAELRNWAATTVEELTLTRLNGKRTGMRAVQLAAEVEEGAMQAMLPLAQQAERECIVACPETGQGPLGVTALEVLAIADHLRTNRSPAEQKRIHDRAVESSIKIASRTGDDRNLPPLPCPLQGRDGVCWVYAARPLLCRPLHAKSIAKGMGNRSVEPAGSQTQAPGVDGREQTIAEGFEIGLTRALKSAGLDANIYELSSALAVALETPDAAQRWANGEKVFAGLPEQSIFQSSRRPAALNEI